MKNVKACPEAKPKDMNFKLWLLAFSFVLLAFIVFGCNESLQRTIGFPNNVRIEDLKAKAIDRKSTRLNSSHTDISRMPSSA